MEPVLSQPETKQEGSTVLGAPKIGILIVAYNAASTLARVLDRVPEVFRPRISQIFVCDDASEDSTYLVGLGYQQLSDLPLKVIRHPGNLGYGGNQKVGYQLAIDYGLDIVVLLHGDGQYAPECLAEIVAPLERGECDAVLGSRMIVKSAALKGGMPLYKYVGNRILTRFENRMLGTSLSEFHSGYRAYSVKALSALDFQRNSDGFNFDTQIIIQLVEAGKRIVEVPIPTYYGDEICYVNGLAYARDVTGDVLRYRLEKLGFLAGDEWALGDEYGLKQESNSSHAVILDWLAKLPPGNVLDLGCSSGLLSQRMRAAGHQVTGVDVLKLPDVDTRVDRFVHADLDRLVPDELRGLGPFDAIVAADVLEHVREPEALLAEIHGLLAPRGVLIASVPNFGHWYARSRTLLGLFDYDQRGILDRGHIRFFTRRSFRRRLTRTGFDVVRTRATGVPLEVLSSGADRWRALRVLDRAAVAMWPTLFGYQFVFQCDAAAPRASAAGR
jgi:glycosyltransferase involved in cell wall biosynthesis